MTQHDRIELLREREQVERKIAYIRRHISKICIENNHIPIRDVENTLLKLKSRLADLTKLLGRGNAVMDKFTNIIKVTNNEK